jgi:TPR repeat protein
LLLCSTLLALPGTGRADAFYDGLAAYNVGNYATAYSLWQPLAEHDDAKAQSGLGYLHYRGLGVPRDATAAAAWFQRAAEGGEPGAQLFLVLMHYYGDGLPQDFELAHVWSEIALGGGQLEALEWREETAARLSEAELESARRRIFEWYRDHPG